MITIEEMEKLESKATPGPWEVEISPIFCVERKELGGHCPQNKNMGETPELCIHCEKRIDGGWGAIPKAYDFYDNDTEWVAMGIDNANFCAAAREFVPWAIAEIKRLLEENSQFSSMPF